MNTKNLPMYKYWLETYGCQMNKAESRLVEIAFDNMGLTPAESPRNADIILLNTCSVRKTAEERIEGRLGYYSALKRKQDFALVVMGCMAQRLKDQLIREFPAIDTVVGTFDKNTFLEIMQKHGSINAVLANRTAYEFADYYTNREDITAFVPIMHGCNNYCTYCIVPYVRGREISRDPAAVLEETAARARSGCREIIVLGQNVNSYNGKVNRPLDERFNESAHKGINGDNAQSGADISFPDLLELIVARTTGSPWIRFITSHPKDFSPQLVSVIKENDQVCKGIHLPVQSGSDSILNRMNRKYTRNEYLDIIGTLKREIPDISISTDLLVGFPGETEKDFIQTLELIKTVEFSDAFTYKYNPREGTAAFSFEDTVTEEEKKERLKQLIDLQRSISINTKKKKIDNTVKVLIEGVSKKSGAELLGRTEYNEMVVFPGEKEQVGSFTYIKLTSLSGNTFKGEQFE